MVEQDVYTALTSASSITEIVASRIYPVALPKNPTLPAIDYRFVAGSNKSTFGTSGAQAYRIEINCWGETYADAVTLRNVVVKALSGYRAGNTTLSFLMPQDFFEEDLLQFRALAEFRVLAVLT